MADSKSISSGGNATSDTETLNQTINSSKTVIARRLQVKADNDGTPAAGDTATIYPQMTIGDPDGASTNEFDTDDQAVPVVLDTNENDPSIGSIDLPIAALELKLYAENDSGGRAITVSGTVLEIDEDGGTNEVQISWP